MPLFQEQLLRIAMVAAGFTGGEAEELRRAMGFKRSVRRMQKIETKLRDGMQRQGIDDNAIEEIVQSVTSFALYGFPESHAASFALLVYASAYLKAHYPAAFYTALLNNQPMGFYSPATLVKDAQRRGVRFAGIDVQHSNWECKVEEDGKIRLGLSYVSGLRETVGLAIESTKLGNSLRSSEVQDGYDSVQSINLGRQVLCPKCWTNDLSALEINREEMDQHWLCNTCSYDWTVV